MAAASLLTFIVCGWDKFAAKRQARRVPERWLFLLSACLGAPGMLAGMLAFRHKTRHMSFRILVPILFVAQYIGGLLLYRYVQTPLL